MTFFSEYPNIQMLSFNRPTMPGFYRTEVDPFTNKILKFCPICNVDTKGNPTRHMKTYHPDFWENRIKAMNGVESEIEPIPSPQISVYNVFINSVSNAGLGHDDIPGFSDNPEKKMDHNKSPMYTFLKITRDMTNFTYCFF